VQDVLEDEALTIYTDGSMFGSPRRGVVARSPRLPGFPATYLERDTDEDGTASS